jgi:cytochrome c biogenesis protein CcmG, thiol:disulfide interchange protein DsbE
VFVGALAALAVLCALYFGGRSHISKTKSNGGKEHLAAPDFNLPQLDGQQLRLSSYRGKVVLLDFWATWCVPCREEIPHFVELQQKYGDRGFQVIGVSMDDSADPVGPFYRQFHMNYPVVMGNAKIGEFYGGVLGLPIAFVIDRDGRIQSKHIGATKAEIFEKEIAQLLGPN